jgi:hypothetical protein
LDLYNPGSLDPGNEFQEGIYPDITDPPGPLPESTGARIPVWQLPVDSDSSSVSCEFKMPTSYTFNTDITVDAHILLQRTQASVLDGNIQLRLRADFRSDDEQWGENTGNFGYKQTVLSALKFVREPTGMPEAGNKSARHFIVSFTLPGGEANPRDWALLTIDRVVINNDPYSKEVYLGVVSVRYDV